MSEVTSPDTKVQNLRCLKVTEVAYVLHVNPVTCISKLRFASHREHTEQIIWRVHCQCLQAFELQV